MSAKASATGVWATSEPRMLKVQAIAWGSETTSASALSFLISARTRSSLCAAASPENCRSCDTTAPVGRRRAVAPDRIDRIGLGRDQDGTDAGAGLGEAFGALGAVQPGIVAELLARCEVRLDPRARRRIDEVRDGEQRAVDLVARLGGVAAVDEQHGAVGEDDRGAGRSGEAGQPGEALLAGGQVFVLMAVGMGHDEAVEPAPRQLGAQGRDARRRLSRFRRIIEGLELRVELADGGFVHGG